MEKFIYSEDNRKLVEKVIWLRQNAKMDQEAFGILLGVDQTTISRIENFDRTISIQELIILCRYFHLTFDFFVEL
jgi:transcriptional regulator with XRE-family HTH domain